MCDRVGRLRFMRSMSSASGGLRSMSSTSGGLCRLLVANRGEIALRVIRAAAELDISTVAVFTPPDAASLHARAADHA
eukprot:4255188-Prymnesium_polylepis.1